MTSVAKTISASYQAAAETLPPYLGNKCTTVSYEEAKGMVVMLSTPQSGP